VKWRKRGLVYAPDGSLPWARHHALPPTPLRLDDELLRIYVGSLDERNVGRIGYVDVLAERPSEVVRVAQEPVLDIGEPGCFDDNGLVPTCALRVGDQVWLYYTGYQLGVHVPYFQFLGLAISRDGGESFTRHSRAPVLDRSDAEPLTRASASVSREDHGSFRMYYSAGAAWTEDRSGKRLPVYNVRALDSPDGVAWGPEGRVCIDFADDEEHAIARPWPRRSGDGWELLYSVRTRSRDYRIGYATSADGRNWERRDGEAGIEPSDSGWDAQAVAYGSVVEHAGSTYLFYCGNERGMTGFGYAELEASG
jgi:predicted GH43/DUF377 family glycosyl hydrolase